MIEFQRTTYGTDRSITYQLEFRSANITACVNKHQGCMSADLLSLRNIYYYMTNI